MASVCVRLRAGKGPRPTDDGSILLSENLDYLLEGRLAHKWLLCVRVRAGKGPRPLL